jgi:hypothetical protein
MHPGTSAQMLMTGTMHEIDYSRFAALLAFAGRLFGALVHRRGRNIIVAVRNWTALADAEVHWPRTFKFDDRKTAVFAARMAYLGGDEVIEYVRLGLGMRMRLAVDDGRLVYTSTGYQWDIGPLSIRLPAWLLLGRGYICQCNLSADEFEMDFRMEHPLFGPTYRYAGRFRIQSLDTHQAQ